MARFAAALLRRRRRRYFRWCSPASVDDRAVIPAVPGTSFPLITFFTNVKYGGSEITFVGEKTTGCIGATAPFIKSVSSVQLNQPDIACNLWSEANCAGVGGIVVSDNIPSLITFGFNDLMVSYNCYSTA
ncbi:hypothetical protein K438DRAFT_1964612 [Mycena galopus ATCC 62051]|nr:hypothetical protein K438DRAFT_1964612 [Mycena galopus ATCC 62051]